MSSGIKPIETVYNGYRFRSRLEARWAVFLDALRIPYEFEHQGYDLGEWGWYLPDFWLPREEAYVEIKPFNQWFYDPKYEELSKLGCWVFHVAGNPWPGEYRIAVYEDGACWGAEPYIFAEGRRVEGELWLASDYEQTCVMRLSDEPRDYDRPPLEDSKNMMQAYKLARQARFEHGANR